MQLKRFIYKTEKLIVKNSVMKKLMVVQLKYLFLYSVIGVLLIGCKEEVSTPFDWPQFKKDNFRSGNSEVQLDVKNLGTDWVYNAPQLPSPAWYGPAKEDTYANSGPLPSMRDYDLAYYPIIVGEKLYYGSTSDHAIHCLDTNTGKELWTFTTGGPIRVAPTFYRGKLYFGSDDGYAYCIKAKNGSLVWQFSPSEKTKQRVMNNNSLISFWPVRTGVLIEDETAYFGASLLPWKDSYFCAVDIKSGKVSKPNNYVKKYEDLTLEGSMASTGTKIIQPQGRVSPMFFNKATGESKGQLAGTGGCFVLITPDKNIIHPQTSREKSIMETIGEGVTPITDSNPKQANFMSFKGGKEMLVKGNVSYILTDNSISAYDRTSKKVIWSKRNYLAHRIILSGDVLYVGGTDAVYALNIEDGNPLWDAKVDGTVYALAVAKNGLYASTGEGRIYKFSPNTDGKHIAAEKKIQPIVNDSVAPKNTRLESGNLKLAVGPFVNILGPHKIELHFQTKEPVISKVHWANDFTDKYVNEDKPTTEHRIVVDELRKDFTYQYQIEIEGEKSKAFEFDNFFNYSAPYEKKTSDENLHPDFRTINELNKNAKGLAILLGSDKEKLAMDVARHTPLKAIVFENSKSKVLSLREKWQSTGLYGGKLTIHYAENYDELPITNDVANIVVANKNTNSSVEEVIRLIKPNGHGLVGQNKKETSKWIAEAKNQWQVTVSNLDNVGYIKKRPHEDAGKWTHQYGLPNNSAFGGESLWGSTTTEDFEIQWMGRPGPRFQTDRSGRKPSPLAVDGKMFVQGRERVIAVDAYNGNVFWSKEIPELSRMNIIRDCSNWSADEEYLYIAHKDNLLKIDHDNGKISRIIPVSPTTKSSEIDWGYISLIGNKIIGTSIPKSSTYTNYYGGEGWYDAQSGPLTHQIVSHSMFGMDKTKPDNLWLYEPKNTHILNSTITITNNQISFIESRNSAFRLSDKKRAGPAIFKNLYLKALNPNTGELLWEKPIQTKPGIAAYFMAGSSDRIVIVSSYEGTYYIYNYDANSGKLMWENQLKWPANHHGAHFSKPAIVNNRLIVKPGVFKLDTGELMEQEVPKAGHGCASYALTEQSAFYRGYSVTQFNFDTNKFTQWERLRPDCWLSTIPAQGMVLSPEAGGGCSCGNWLETSMVFAPKSRAPITFLYEDKKFIDSMKVRLKTKNNYNGTIYYTLDGSEPTNASSQYSQPIIIDKSTTVKALIFQEKNNKQVPFTRTRMFERTRPMPKIVETPQLINGNWEFQIEIVGNTGEVHYSINGSTPTIDSPKYNKPVIFNENVIVKAKTFWREEDEILESKVTSFEMKKPPLIASKNIEVTPGILQKFFKEKSKQTKELPNLNNLQPKTTNVLNKLDVGMFTKETLFGLQFKGYINIPADGMYTFTNKTKENYCNIYFHNEKKIENKRGQEKQQIILGLKKGLHPITIDYFVTKGVHGLDFEIEGPNLPKTSIPSVMLFH